MTDPTPSGSSGTTTSGSSSPTTSSTSSSTPATSSSTPTASTVRLVVQPVGGLPHAFVYNGTTYGVGAADVDSAIADEIIAAAEAVGVFITKES